MLISEGPRGYLLYRREASLLRGAVPRRWEVCGNIPCKDGGDETGIYVVEQVLDFWADFVCGDL